MDRDAFPRLVAIETTNYCNARCAFCPNSALARGRQHMADDLFESIIDQCTKFDLPAIEPFLQGEPFCDPKIMDRLRTIRARLPRTRLRLYSNGHAVTPARVNELLGLGIDHLFISVNTLNAAKYRATVGLRFERTLANLEYMAQHRERLARKLTFRMTRTADTTLAEQDEFLAFCKKRGVESFIVGLFNYKGIVDSPMPVPSYPCEHMSRIDILASGKVALCCMDHEGEYPWGDARTQPILDIYRGEVASRYRGMLDAGRRREIEPCDRCNLFWPDLRGQPFWRKARYGIEAGWYFVRYRPSGRYAPAGGRQAARRLPVVESEHRDTGS